MLCEIATFAERDIDVWLAEEFLFNADFCRWFLSEAGVSDQLSLPAFQCKISVTDDVGRETDVEALFRRNDGGVLALLVEDKIKAPFQPNQMEDYLERGNKGLKSKTWSEYCVAVFAPSYRTLSVPEPVKVLTFDKAADALLSAGASERTEYRADFLRQANKPTAKVSEEISPAVIAWWYAVDEMLNREFGGFFVVDRKNFPKQTWIAPRMQNMPDHLRVDLKGHLGEVDLAFKDVDFEAFRAAVDSLPRCQFILVKNSKSSALRISGLEPFTISDGIDVVSTRVRAAFEAAKTLLMFWQEHRAVFDAITDRTGS